MLEGVSGTLELGDPIQWRPQSGEPVTIALSDVTGASLERRRHTRLHWWGGMGGVAICIVLDFPAGVAVAALWAGAIAASMADLVWGQSIFTVKTENRDWRFGVVDADAWERVRRFRADHPLPMASLDEILDTALANLLDPPMSHALLHRALGGWSLVWALVPPVLGLAALWAWTAWGAVQRGDDLLVTAVVVGVGLPALWGMRPLIWLPGLILQAPFVPLLARILRVDVVKK